VIRGRFGIMRLLGAHLRVRLSCAALFARLGGRPDALYGHVRDSSGLAGVCILRSQEANARASCAGVLMPVMPRIARS